MVGRVIYFCCNTIFSGPVNCHMRRRYLYSQDCWYVMKCQMSDFLLSSYSEWRTGALPHWHCWYVFCHLIFLQVKNSNHVLQGPEDNKNMPFFQHYSKRWIHYAHSYRTKDESIVTSKFMQNKFSIRNSPKLHFWLQTPKHVSSFRHSLLALTSL